MKENLVSSCIQYTGYDVNLMLKLPPSHLSKIGEVPKVVSCFFCCLTLTIQWTM